MSNESYIAIISSCFEFCQMIDEFIFGMAETYTSLLKT